MCIDNSIDLRTIVGIVFLEDADSIEGREALHNEGDRPSSEPTLSEEPAQLPLKRCRFEFLRLLSDATTALANLPFKQRAKHVPALCSIFCQLRCRLSQLCTLWTDILAETFGGDDVIKAEDLYESSVFVSNASSILLRCINCGNLSQTAISASVNIGILPPLPWADLSTLTVSNLDADVQWGSWSWSAALDPLSSVPQEDESSGQHYWSQFMLEIDVIEGSLSFLQHLHRLSRILSTHQQSTAPVASGDELDNVDSVFLHKVLDTAVKNLQHLSILTLSLQNEVLFIANCLVFSCRGEGYLKYKYLGSSVLNTILVDIGAEITEDCLQTALQYQLGMLCIRHHELAMLEKYRHAAAASASSDDDGLLLESLSGFMSWMARNCVYKTRSFYSDDSINIEASAPTVIPVPEYCALGIDGKYNQCGHVLWPWTEPNQSENASTPPNSLSNNQTSSSFWIPVRKFCLIDTTPSHTDNPVLEWADILDNSFSRSVIAEPPPPWFLGGRSGRMWMLLFSVLYHDLNYIQSLSHFKQKGPLNSVFLSKLKIVIGSVCSSLEQLMHVPVFGIDDSLHPDPSKNAPLLQMNFLLFLSRCVKSMPDSLILAAREVDLWDVLLCTDSFLIGGCDNVSHFMSKHLTSSEECAKLEVTDVADGNSIVLRSSPRLCDVDEKSQAGYFWVYLHDGVFSIFNEVIQRCLVSSTIGYPRFEIIKFFEAFKMFGKCGADDLVFQGARWLSSLIDAGRGQNDAVATVPEFLAVIISLNICGQQVILVDSVSGFDNSNSDVDSAPGSGERKDISSKILAPVSGRPFLWHARSALIELILRVKVVSSHPKWLDVYLTSSQLSKPSNSGYLSSLPGQKDHVDGSPPLSDASLPKLLSIDESVGSEPNSSNAGSPSPSSHSKSASSILSGVHLNSRAGQSLKIPSVNTLRYLLSDPRCQGAISYIFGEICLRAASSVVSTDSKKFSNKVRAPDSKASHSKDRNSRYEQDISSAASAASHLSEQNKSWLAAMRPSAAFSSSIPVSDNLQPPVTFLGRLRSTSSGDTHTISSLMLDNPADAGTNSLSPLLTAASKLTVSPQQLIYEIFRVMLDQIKVSSKLQSLSEAIASAKRILVQLLRLFRDPQPLRRACLQDLWSKKHIWSLLLGSLLTFLKAPCCTVDEGNDAGPFIELKMQFLHLNLSLMNSIMAGGIAYKDSFREFMASSMRSTSQTTRGSVSTQPLRRPSKSDVHQGKERTLSGNDASIYTSYDPIQRKPYKFNDFRTMLAAALQPIQLAGSYRAMETILVLMEMLFDGPVLPSNKIMIECTVNPDRYIGGLFASTDDRPKIVNYIAVPVLITILPLLHVNDQICLLNSFQSLVKGRASLYNLSICSQMTPSMLDLVLDVFPGMPISVQDSSVGLLQTLGRHSISVSQLKRVFRMMQSRGDFRPSYTARLLTSLKGMIAEGEQPRHTFVFEGASCGLQLPCINKWPAPRGYTFSIWLLVESPKQVLVKIPSDSLGESGSGGVIAKKLYKPHLLSLRCRNGAGLDISLHGGVGKGKFKICLNSHGFGEDCSSLTFPGLLVTEGKWHYFAVSHAAGGAFSSRGEISVLLDEQYFRMKDSFPYPRFSDPIDCPLIGDCPEKFKREDETALRGQLSAIYFFSEALSEGQMRGVRGLGPNYVYSFEPHNIVHRDMSVSQSAKKQTVDPVLSVLDGSLTSLIMLAYNPAVWSGDYFLDNTPDKNIVKWGGNKTSIVLEGGIESLPKPSFADDAVTDRFQVLPIAGKMHALRRPGTYRSTTQDAKLALDSLGGIKVLLPLFAQFDQPRLPAVAVSGPDISKPVTDILDTQLSQVVLELLLVLLDNSGHNSRLMTKISGFSLIAYLLERVSPEHLTIEVVHVLWQLRERLFWSPSLQDHLLEHLLTNFGLWVRASFSVQQAVVDRLLSLCVESPSRVRDVLPIQRLLDFLLLQYYYEEPAAAEHLEVNKDIRGDNLVARSSISAIPPDRGSLDDEMILDEILNAPDREVDTNEFISTQDTFLSFISRQRSLRVSIRLKYARLSVVELVLIRSKLVKVLYTLMTQNEDGVSADDLRALIGYALITTCGRSKEEALRVILRIMSVPAEEAETKVPSLFAAFSRCHCFQALLNLHKHKSAKVRLYMFLIFCKLIYLSCLYPLPEHMKQSISGSAGENGNVEQGNNSGGMSMPNASIVDSSVSIAGDKLPRNVGLERTNVTSIQAEDVYFLDIIGIPVSSLGDLMLWIIEVLCQQIRVDIEESAGNDSRHVRLQCRTIAQAMLSTLLGDSCDYLVFDIDELSGKMGDTMQTSHKYAPGDSSMAPATPQPDLPGDTAAERVSSPTLSPGEFISDRLNTDLLDPLGVRHAPDGTLLNTPVEMKKNAWHGSTKKTLTKKSSSSRNLFEEVPTIDIPTNRNRSEGLLSSSIVCAPMLFAAILSMVRFEGLQISLGLSVLVNLKTTILQNDHNADAILATSSWQFWILQLIISEKKRLVKFEKKFNDNSNPAIPDSSAKEGKRYMEKSAALIDTCMRMISDLQLIAVRLGRLLCKPTLYCPLKSYPQRIMGMDVLRDIGRGRRQLGATVLRDTMSYFRMYGERGDLDAQQSGFDLLMQILFSLQLEKTLLENKSSTSVFTIDDDYATKVATLSKWLIGAIVFDFISVPITQGAAISRTENSAVAPANVRRRLQSSSFDCRSSDSSEHAAESINSIMMEGSSTDELHTSFAGTFGLVGCVDASLDTANIKMRNLLDERVEQTWKLIDGLLTMYGPLNNATWWSLVGMKLKAVGQLGLMTGLSALSQISDGIEAIMPTSIPSSTNQAGGPIPSRGNVFHISGTPSKTSAKLDSPLVGTAYSVCWLLTRALESVYLIGGDVTSNESISLEALAKLRNLLSGLKTMGADFVEFESRNITSRICSGITTSTQPIKGAWARGGMEYLCELLLSQRSFFLELVLNEIGVPLEKIHSQDTLNHERRKCAVGDGDATSALQIVNVCLRNSVASNSSIVDMALTIVKASLAPPPEIEEKLTWDIWIRSINPIAEEINRLEHDLVLARLNEIGLHKHTQEIKKDLERYQYLSAQVSDSTVILAEKSRLHLFQTQTDRLSAVARIFDRQDRLSTSKWSKIVSELANERGPWGCSTEDQTTVFWMMDSATTTDFRRPRLKRNEQGVDHRTASLLTRGTYSENPASQSVAANAIVSSVEAAPAEKSGGGLAQGLWRDLVKYQRQDVASPDRADVGETVEQVDDGDVLEDNNAIQGNAGEISAAVSSLYVATGGLDAEKVLFKEQCEIITPAANSAAGGTLGILEVYKSKIVFIKTADFDYLAVGQKLGNTDFLWACQNFPSSAWHCSHIVNVFQRSYQLRFVAIEIFFTNRRSLFVNLHNSATAELLLTTIRRKIRPPYIAPYFGRTPKVVMSRFSLPGAQNPISLTEAWQCREISNYEYLTYLNLIAGRTYNDLGQYPVFPWVLADYTSKKLDLRNPESFRDFKFSMGAQKLDQRMQFIDKYYDLKANYDADQEYARKNNLQSIDSLPPFHYGSHYSCMGFVLWYLLRHEPFTSLNVWLQDGKFDKADRLFDSIEAAWRGCTTNQSDVKELIPEFFYNSDFLDNYNNIDLGTTQLGRQLGPVKLPRWAKNSHDFIHQHREALESDYVSMNLHHWIDLIFGYKQRPPHMGGSQASVDSVNIYFHLTYAGAVDLDQLKESDPYLYSQTVRQIDNFGQTPTQLFDKPHVQRQPFDKCDIIWPMASVVRGVDTIPKGQPPLQKPRKVICFKFHQVSDFPVIFIGEAGALERLVTVDSSRIVGWHFWQVRQPDVVPPYQLKVDPQALRISQGLTATGPFSIFPGSYQSTNRERRIGAPFAPPQLFNPHHLSETPILYIANKRLFCQEETDRLNIKPLSSSVSELPGSRNRSISTASRSGKVDGRSRQNSNFGQSLFKSTDTYDARKYSTTGNGDTTILSNSKPRVDERLSPSLFAFLGSSNLIFSCGHWDNSFKVSVADTGRLIQSISHHRDVVTCLTVCSEYSSTWLITGSRDCTVMVWEVVGEKALPLSSTPLYILYGHDDAVNCVAVNLELDVIVSGSDDGSIIIHSLRDGGSYIRSIFLYEINSMPSTASVFDMDGTGSEQSRRKSSIRNDVLRRVTWVGVSREGYIVSYSSQDSTLCTHTLNGKIVVRREAGEHLHAFLLSEDGKVLITGGDRSLLVMRWVHNLELANDGLRKGFEAVLDGSNSEDAQGPMISPIRSLYLTKKERHLLVGLESGELRVMTQVFFTTLYVLICDTPECELLICQDSDYLRRRLHYKLMEIGILPQNHVRTCCLELFVDDSDFVDICLLQVSGAVGF